MDQRTVREKKHTAAHGLRRDQEVITIRFQNQEKERLDHYLVETLPKFSRSRLQGYIKSGFVDVDGKVSLKSGQMLEPGSFIELHIPPPKTTTLVGEDIPLKIVFENKDLLVIDKPAGMVVHPSAGHFLGPSYTRFSGMTPTSKASAVKADRELSIAWTSKHQA